MAGLRDLFKKKLEEQRQIVTDTAELQTKAIDMRTGVPAEFEPKLRSIVLETFEALHEMNWPKAQVIVGGRNGTPNGVTAYALSRFGSYLTNNIDAEVVIDSNGKIAFHHLVRTADGRPDQAVVSCIPLDDAYESLLRGVVRTDNPQGETLSMNSTGDIILCQITGMDRADRPTYDCRPLSEYLATRAAHTVAGT